MNHQPGAGLSSYYYTSTSANEQYPQEPRQQQQQVGSSSSTTRRNNTPTAGSTNYSNRDSYDGSNSSTNTTNREDWWHNTFVDLTYSGVPSLKTDPVQCFHMTFNELSQERPDLCRVAHLGHILELPTDEEGRNIFLSRYFQLYAKQKQGGRGGNHDNNTSSSNAKDAFNNMLKNLKNRGYKRKGNLLLLPFHQIKKCIDMTVAQNNMKTNDGRGWCIENKKEAKTDFQTKFNQIWTDKNIFKCRYKVKFQEIETVLLQCFYYEKSVKDNNTLIFCETDETIPTSIHSEDLLWMMNSSNASSSSCKNPQETNQEYERKVEYYIQAVATCTRLASKITHDYAWLEEKLVSAVVSSIPNSNINDDQAMN